MHEWNVYMTWQGTSKYLGTVYASDSVDAKMAALCKFDIPDDAELSVSMR